MEFIEFSKIARLSREMIITEKIDGTNATIYNGPEGMLVGSKSRWITPEQDNYGFARWAYEHEEELRGLGEGWHRGEWWGSGCQRGYDLPKGEKRFSLFNVTRWCLYGSDPQVIPSQDPRVTKIQEVLPPCVGLVPVLYRGMFDTKVIDDVLLTLKVGGSIAAPGFMRPEGIVVYHVASGHCYKKTIDKDGEPKGAK